MVVNFLTRLRSELKKLVISREAGNPEYLQTLFLKDPNFMRYQYSATTLGQSIYNNVVLRYKHCERVHALLSVSTNVHKILDVGCGYGDLSLELANERKQVVLLEINCKELPTAKHRFTNLGLKGDLVCGDAHRLPFKDSSFDMSFSSQVVEHVADPFKIIREKLRVSNLKAVVMCGNRSFSVPGVYTVYFRLITRKEPENVPNIGNYDEILYLNHQLPPLNSTITIRL